MKLLTVTAGNFLGAPRKTIAFSAPVVVIAGPNGAGKSSLIEAIRFGLTGTTPRGVKFKKDYDQLLTQGAKAGTVKIEFDHQGQQQEIIRKVGDGKLISGDELDGEAELLGMVLDAHSFTRLDTAAQRAFVFKLLRVRNDWTTVRAELVEAGIPTHITYGNAEACPNPVMELIEAFIKRGFPDTLAQVQARAAEARGAWTQITGQKYGCNIAASWVAPGAETGEEDGVDVAPLESAVAEAKRNLAAAQLELSNLKHQAEAYAALQEKIKALPTAASLFKREGELQTALDALEAELRDLDAKATGRGGTTAPCPCCGASITYDRGEFFPASDGRVPGPEDLAAANVKRAEVNGARQALGDHRRAQAAAEATRGTTLPEIKPAQVKAAEKAVATAEGVVAKAEAARAAAGAGSQAVQEAKRRTVEAMELHETIAAWEHAADLLKPEGVPTTLLLRGLKPLNKELARLADEIGWERPVLGADFSIRVGDTLYPLLSESEQWRVDTVIAAAIAKIGGLRLLLLDRFDVLDNFGRNDLLGWLGTAGADEFDTVIAAGTMEKKPTVLTEKFGVHVIWLAQVAQAVTEEA